MNSLVPPPHTHTTKPAGPSKKKCRNQVLRNKFFDAKEEIKESHPHIIALFDGSKSRDLQTDIIENCFKKDEQGKWQFDMDRPFFQEQKRRHMCRH